MAKFTPTKRGNPCLLCGDIKGKCRIGESVRLCMNLTDVLSHPPDYKFIGLTKDGLWGKFVEDNGQHFSRAEREQWRREQELRRRQRAILEAKRKALSLPFSERDHLYRELLASLTLSQVDRADLERRGLTDEEIKAGGFKSVEQWQKLAREIDHRLPGVNLDGLSLNTQPGYLCPVKDIDGLIVGCQIRLRNAEDGGRYRWLTSATKKRPDGATPHLPSGELPIAVHRPSELKQHSIGLAEGTGVKPFAAAQRLGQVVVGAAGGQWGASPKALKETLDQFSDKLGTKHLVLYADGGAIANPQVMRQYRRTYALAKKLGYKLRIGWWGQLSKNDLDIDELLTAGRGNEIQEITFAQFEALANNPNNNRRSLNPDGLKLFVKRIIERYRPKKGFGNVPTPEPTQPNLVPDIGWIDYKPGKLFKPQPGLTPPKIRFKKGQRIQFYIEAVMAGWKEILDISQPGLGKSYDAGRLHPAEFGVARLIYFCQSPMNPTTETVERNYTPMPTRYASLLEDPSRKTPLGKSFRRHPKIGEVGMIPGNCHLAPLHAAAQSKNIGVGASAANENGSDINPICRSCQFLKNHSCPKTTGNGFGYKQEVKEVLSSAARISSTLLGFPSTDVSNTGVIIDEALANIEPIKRIEATEKDLVHTFALLKNNAPELMTDLLRVHDVIANCISGVLPLPDFGWDFNGILEQLGQAPPNTAELIEAITDAIKPDWHFLRDGTTAEQLDLHVAKNWLIPFLEVWTRLVPGAIRIEKGRITVTLRNDRSIKLLKGAKWRIYQDATATRETLALWMDIPVDGILVAEQDPVKPTNLEILHVHDLGLVGKNRSDFCQGRVDVLRAALTKKHVDIGFIDHLRRAKTGELAHFSGGRGSNEYASKSAIASFGTPYTRLGTLQDIYQTLTTRRVSIDKLNPDIEFQKFVEEITQSEIVQEIGRIRATQRPDDNLTYYYIGNFNLSFLESLGYRVQRIKACDVTPEAGSAHEQNWWKITQAFEELRSLGQKITQDAVAALSGVAQSTISWLTNGQWKKLSFLLLDPYRDFDIFDHLDEDGRLEAECIAQDILPTMAQYSESPEELIYHTTETIKAYGWRVFEAGLKRTSDEVQAKILASLLWLLPPELQDEIRALALGAT